jgi:DNA replication protein DnaC
LKKREELKVMGNLIPSTLKDETFIEIVERIKKEHPLEENIKPKTEELSPEIHLQVEDAEYNEKRAICHLERCFVPPKYFKTSFDNFIGNDKIKQVCKDYAKIDDNILIMGPTGCGKTHLAISVLRYFIEQRIIKMPMQRSKEGKLISDPCYPAGLFITVPRLLMDLRSVYTGDRKKRNKWDDNIKATEEDVINEYVEEKFLILDDLGAEKTTDFSLTSLYMIIDERINNFKRTIITTNLSLQDIEQKMDARIASRLSGMKTIKLNMPDYRKKRVT